MKKDAITLQKHEIQGLVFSGYPKNEAGIYLLLGVVDRARARAWLRALLGDVTFGEPSGYGATLNVAISAPGLTALGLDAESLATFPIEFREGLRERDDGYRPRILGDVGDSAPSRWDWGGPAQPEVHVLLMLFGPKNDASFSARVAEHRARFAGALEELHAPIDTVSLPDRREHFGFVDGIAQPRFEGQRPRSGASEQPIKAGEFLFGYDNEFGKRPSSPSVGASASASCHLQSAPGGDRKDLGANGTFLVMRQLEQDVAGFWRSMAEHSKNQSGEVDQDQALWLASKCVGRWPSGAPLVRSPDQDDPAFRNDNDFDYSGDAQGFRCPVGAHIRKANPRDSLEPSRDASVVATRRRRIVRRGRAYGPALAKFTSDDGAKRGLVFIGLNTNIRRQFEFIQQSWLNNEKFSGLYEDQDPIVGDQTPGYGATFTIPAHPLRRRLVGLERFVQVRGGEYFFLPSKSALGYLSEPASAKVADDRAPANAGGVELTA
jgi:Dyp-type peroxidase family